MNDAVGVQISDCGKNLTHDLRGLSFGKVLCFCNIIKQFSSLTELGDEVDCVFVIINLE